MAISSSIEVGGYNPVTARDEGLVLKIYSAFKSSGLSRDDAAIKTAEEVIGIGEKDTGTGFDKERRFRIAQRVDVILSLS